MTSKKKTTTPRVSETVPEDASGKFEDFIARTEQRARKMLADAGWKSGMPLENDAVTRAWGVLKEIQFTKKSIRAGNADDAAILR